MSKIGAASQDQLREQPVSRPQPVVPQPNRAANLGAVRHSTVADLVAGTRHVTMLSAGGITGQPAFAAKPANASQDHRVITIGASPQFDIRMLRYLALASTCA